MIPHLGQMPSSKTVHLHPFCQISIPQKNVKGQDYPVCIRSGKRAALKETVCETISKGTFFKVLAICVCILSFACANLELDAIIA